MPGQFADLVPILLVIHILPIMTIAFFLFFSFHIVFAVLVLRDVEILKNENIYTHMQNVRMGSKFAET